MEYSISINKKEMLDALHGETAYISAKLIDQDKDSYKRIATTEVDEDYLLNCVYESYADILSTLKQYSPSVEHDSLDVTFTLNVPSNFDIGQEYGLLEDTKNYFIHYTLYKWFSLTNKQDAENQLQTAIKYLSAIKVLCTARVSPTCEETNNLNYKNFFYE